ncbi:MAG: TonB-dependent receptor [Bacteroidia bacterium]
MKKWLLYILLFAGLFAKAQVSLVGSITQDSIANNLSGVAVSIPELNLLTQTNENGHYRLNNLPKGKFTVSFKLLGYEPKAITINLNDTVVKADVSLKQSFLQYPEVVVYGTNNSATNKTANTISQIDAMEMRATGAMNLSDGIAKIPGVSQLTTGAGISKPVIRGLYGNRVLTVLYGLRFDNQQWQDEHGLGLTDVGIDRVEIIKGAASLLYGSEAMGGVINIIEEKSAPVGTVKADFSTRFFSNTYGNATDVGVKGAHKKINWRIRFGEDSHADYSDGNGRRILNSRFGGYYAKAGFGFNLKRWVSQNNYMLTQNNFGFLMDTVQLRDVPDERTSRSFDRPHHTVNLNIFSSQNTFFIGNSKLKVNLGFQGNNRMEQEGGNKISLNMLLNSYITNIVWTKMLGDKVEFNIGTQDFYQTNTNLGSRTIIPDAKVSESSVFSYTKISLNHLVLEGGIRYDFRSIQTFPTGTINTDSSGGPGVKIVPFSRNYSALNGCLGISWFDSEHFNVKSNFSTGYRSGNLAELSSNGLHEGTYRYEIGNIDMKIEQNICGDLAAAFRSSFINISATGYYNHFLNYIYLAPSNTEYIGFQIYNYLQSDATIKGAEFMLDIHPQKINFFNWISTYSYVEGKLDNGNNLPFIQAPKLNSDLKFTFRNSKSISEFSIKPGVSYSFIQDRPGDFETTTIDYLLVNASAAVTVTNKKSILQLSLSGNNLLNQVYYDHLSRFKYYGIYNIGRNVSINLKLTI